VTDYRYALKREVNSRGDGDLAWVMLNPSTADDHTDDPTIRRVKRFTFDAGYASLTVVNLFAARTTRPIHLLSMTDPIGPDNRDAITAAFLGSDAVVFAWGAWWEAQHITRRPTRLNVESLAVGCGHRPLCLGFTKGGEPKHPLYVSASQALVPFSNSLVRP
jgi:hypothetical protein